KAEPKTYEGYTFNAEKSAVSGSGELKAIKAEMDIVTLKLYYDVKKTSSGGSSGGSGGSGGSSSSSSTTTKVDSATGAVIKTTKKSDGSSITTVKQTDGTTTTIKTAANGKAEIKSTLSSKAVAAAQDKDEAVALQIAPVTVATDSKKADAITVDTGSKTKTKVEIPVEDVTEGVVAVVIGADGQQTILKDTVATADGVTVVVADDTTIKLVDNSKEFVDVADAYWGADAVDFVSARGLMNGTGKDRFSPSSDLTRGMIAVILHNYEDNPESAATSAFTDVANGVWYDEAVRWAADEGIMNGYSADVFAPNDSITREQLATILWRYAGSPAAAGKLDRFTDADAVSSYAGAALDWATENGIVTGKGGDTLDPKGNATRAEVATMLMRFCKL
ncbi:MAG: S-layer homology domain-containing protein, partial [Eubacteriales bacterium]|nr:S-layer homology domain-containing protein [Eubacteriales bacterium]